MKENIKFIHCADIHLGANPFEISERFEDMGKALEQVCNFALDEKVDFILIAGDFFHNKVLNPKTLEQAITLLEKLKNANIPVFLTEGNHDMETYSNVYSWLQFLSSRKYINLLRPNKKKNEKILKMWDEKEGCIYNAESAYIIGLGYPGSTAGKYINKVNDELSELIKSGELEDKPIICMLHTGIDRFLTEAMAGLKEKEIDPLLKKVDYLALGHIHTRYENIEKHYYNPGSIECIRITDNPFNKGFYYINMNTKNRKIDSEFKIVKTRNAIALDINVEEAKTTEECEEIILNKVQKEYEDKCGAGSKIMLQLKLNGDIKQGSLDIDISRLKKSIASKIPILHQEIINLIRYVSEDEIVIASDVSREEIDKMVIENKIEKAGFEKEKVSKIYNIIEKMKEYGEKEVIDIENSYGEEIEKMLVDLVDE